MNTILLYGSLGSEFGRVHNYDIRTPAEAVRALSATIKGFKQAFIDGGSYRLIVGGKSTIDLDESENPISTKETIRIVPVITGASGVGKIVLGAALIYASGGLGTGLAASFVQGVGTSMVLGGVSELLFAPPKPEAAQERAENMPSFIFNGAINTTRQGNPVPICYGRMIVGSQVISAGLSVTGIRV